MNKLIKRAFTLIELLVVIAIIGILSGLIVVSMSGVNAKANVAKGQVFSNSLRNALMSDLISEWKLDGGTVGNVVTAADVLDSWSVNNATSISGNPVVKGSSDCVYGNCIYFDGTDDAVSFGSKTAFSMGYKDHTISLWANFDKNEPTQYETLIRTGTAASGTGVDGYWIFRYITNGRLYFYFSDGTANRITDYLTDSGKLVGNTWYHIVIIFDRDSSTQTYINGVKQSQTVSISAQAGDVQNTAGLSFGVAGNLLTGKMDEVRIFNAMPTSAQIKEDYYAGLNSLLFNGGIGWQEYQSRLLEVAYSK